jgi:DNA-entry nuclease
MAGSRNRRRSRRRRSRSSRSSVTTLVAALIVILGAVAILPALQGRSLADLLGAITGAIEAPDVTSAPADTGAGGGIPEPSGGNDEPLAAELGGYIDYGEVVEPTGQRTGITATITPRMLQAADRDQLGSEAEPDIRPPGFDDLPQRNRARGHLLGRQFGGSGEVEANLVALYQSRANSPVMRDYENAVADAVEAGETVRYQVQPLYASPDDNGMPRAVRLRAQGNRGFRMDVEVENSEEAPVTEHVPPGT